MKNLIIILFLASFTFSYSANADKIDSLEKIVSTLPIDTYKVDVLYNISKNYWRDNPEKALLFADKTIDLATKIDYKLGIALGYNSKGVVYSNTSEYKKALKLYQKAISIFIELEDYKGAVFTINNIGVDYKNQGMNDEAMTYYLKALRYSEKSKDSLMVADSKSNISMIYRNRWLASNGKADLENAFKYLKEAQEIYTKANDVFGMGKTHNIYGTIYENTDSLDLALSNYIKAKEKFSELGIEAYLAAMSNNIGAIYAQKKQNAKALEYYLISLKIHEEKKNLHYVASTKNNMALLYKEMGNFAKAKDFSDDAIQIAKEIESNSMLQDAYMALTDIYRANEEYEKALDTYILYNVVKDSIFNDKSANALAEMETKYQTDKKEQQIKLQNTEIENQQLEAKRQNFQKMTFAAGLLLAIAFGFFVFNRLRITRKQKNIIQHQKHMVDEKNKEILDSISYAKRIQNAILPPDKVVKEYLKESFILYKPKDIVAGDFYWMEQKDNKTLFAAADCTGHGVPGAMVSVVCNNALNRSVREHGLTDPGKILTKTREIVVEEFEKSDDDVKDGMDIALCSLQGNQLMYAGANNPLWIVRNGEILETKANKQPIGKFDNPLPYTTHKIELKEGDTFYIFSDGYVDQFGGEKGKKLKAANFRKMLLEMQKESMQKQRELLNTQFEAWRGELEQIDDVCVIGVRI